MLDYLSGKLDAKARDEVDAHVDGCKACRSLLVELARTDMDATMRPDKPKSPDRIGRYRVESRLGEGGVRSIQAARDRA